MHQRNAHAAELRPEIMRPLQHDKAHCRTRRDQKKRHRGQKRRQQEGDDDLRGNDHQGGRELHHVVRRRADAMNIAAHQLGDPRMLQSGHHRQGCSSLAARQGTGSHLDPRQHDVAAGDDNRADDDQPGKEAEQQ